MKMSLSNRIEWGLLSILFVSALPRAHAAEYEYPELLVTPLASERLDREAAREREQRWSRYIPLQVSALSTLATAVIYSVDSASRKDPLVHPEALGFVIGGGWLATTLVMSMMYEPYTSGQKEVQAQTGSASGGAKTPRDKLKRERVSEEAITAAARVGQRMAWISVASQAVTSAIMLSNSQTGTLGRNLNIASLVLAVTPLIFRSSWQEISEQQQEYKKKIYAPIAFATAVPEFSGAGKLVPFAGLQFRF